MFQKLFCICCFLLMTISAFSQNANSKMNQNNIPNSIYYVKEDVYSFYKSSVATNLKLKDFKFLIVDQNDVNDNLFTVDFRNIGRKASTLSYGSYKKNDLYKHFPLLPDAMMIDRFILDQSSSLEAH